MTQHEQIVAAYETYIAENEKFTGKGVKAAAARARKALQEIQLYLFVAYIVMKKYKRTEK